MSAPAERVVRTKLDRFYYYYWADNFSSGLLVLDGIIRPVISLSVLTWFIGYKN